MKVKSNLYKSISYLFILTLFLVVPSQGVIVMEDALDQKYEEYAQQFPAAGCIILPDEYASLMDITTLQPSDFPDMGSCFLADFNESFPSLQGRVVITAAHCVQDCEDKSSYGRVFVSINEEEPLQQKINSVMSVDYVMIILVGTNNLFEVQTEHQSQMG